MVNLSNFCGVTVTPTDSLLVLLIGMLVIFLVLTTLIFVVKGYVGFFKLVDFVKKPKNKKVEQPKEEPKTVAENQAPVAVANDDELIAVITAAISAVYAQTTDDGEVPPFRVKSIFLK